MFVVDFVYLQNDLIIFIVGISLSFNEFLWEEIWLENILGKQCVCLVVYLSMYCWRLSLVQLSGFFQLVEIVVKIEIRIISKFMEFLLRFLEMQ